MTELELRGYQGNLTSDDYEEIVGTFSEYGVFLVKHFCVNPESTHQQCYELFKQLHEIMADISRFQYEKNFPEKEWSLDHKRMERDRKAELKARNHKS